MNLLIDVLAFESLLYSVPWPSLWRSRG